MYLGRRLNLQPSRECETLLQRWPRFRCPQQTLGGNDCGGIGFLGRSSGLCEGEVLQGKALAGTPRELDKDTAEKEETRLAVGPSWVARWSSVAFVEW